MKIVCDSCGAKYSIADEKVAGKVFKIRCKKCSAVIVVKGDQEEGDESTRVFDYGAEAIWHVVIDGDQQGPFAPRQIADLLAEGKIDWEAYVWREGMDGWQPAKDVEVLVSAVMAEAEGTAGAAKPAANPYGTGQVFGGSSDMGADPFAAGADDGGLSGVMGKSASAGAAAGGADLFARSDRSPFSGASEEEGNMMNGHRGGQSPRVAEDQSLTGQRNENSVLFSLSNLQALATGSGSAPASSRPKPGMAQGEGSGLIDIRALASATQAVGEGRANGASKDTVEDLLSVGGGNAFSAASLAAPVAGEKSDSGNTKLIIAGFSAVILLLAGAVGFLVLREPAAAPVAEAPIMKEPAPAAAAAQAAAAPTAAAPTPEQKPAEEARADDSRDSQGDDKAPRSGDSKRRKSGGGGDAPKAAEKTADKAAEAPAPTKSTGGGDRSLDDLLDSALGGKPAKPAAAAAKPAAAPAANLPSMPAKEDVLGAMKGVTPRVQSCGNGQSGVAMAKITVAGATGRVTNVDVSGQFAGTPVATCVTREVTKAKFPKFSQSSFSIAYPFKI